MKLVRYGSGGLEKPALSESQGVALSYRDHDVESGMPLPTTGPPLFLKAKSAISGPFDEREIPRGWEKTDQRSQALKSLGNQSAPMDRIL